MAVTLMLSIAMLSELCIEFVDCPLQVGSPLPVLRPPMVGFLLEENQESVMAEGLVNADHSPRWNHLQILEGGSTRASTRRLNA
jgi:hypothetical protein